MSEPTCIITGYIAGHPCACAADLLRREARVFARKLMLARLAGKSRGAHWQPIALMLIGLARQIENTQTKEQKL